jgi:inosose dehydratase
MRLAYGTYGMPGIRPEDALPRLAGMGYKGVELAAGEKYLAAPQQMDQARRTSLAALCADLGLDVVALLPFIPVMADGDDAHRRNLAVFRDTAVLAADLTRGRTPVVTSVITGSSQPWEALREALVRRLSDYAKVGAETGAVFAVEPHVGGPFDLPDKAAWLVERVAHPAIRLNFDISHFAVVGLDTETCARTVLPYAVHTHVKDGRRTADGRVQFLLPGEGDFDYPAYFRIMQRLGWTDFITVEVSGHVSSRPDYDPFRSAEACFGVLEKARRTVDVASTSRE